MKTATVTTALLACAAFASAAPVEAAAEPKHLEARWGGWWWKRPVRSPFEFTSTYFVKAVPEEVIAQNQTAAPGQPGAVGYYNFGINSHLNTICYNITLVGVDGTYQSLAKTATHVHEAVKGRAGPPRLAFMDPVADANNPSIRRSAGCLTGPFITGVLVNGTDTGANFKVSQIEANPKGFFADVHTNLYVSGAVRGQLAY